MLNPLGTIAGQGKRQRGKSKGVINNLTVLFAIKAIISIYLVVRTAKRLIYSQKLQVLGSGIGLVMGSR